MMLLKNSFRRIVKDFRHKELLPLKLIFFVQASTLYVLYPYLTIHMRELGINVEETAIMSAVTPFVAIIMPPLAGLIADRIGNFKILLSLFSSLGGAAALLLLLVPIGRVTVQFPDRVVMNVACPGVNGEMLYGMDQSHPCVPNLQPEVHTRLESCGYVCRVDIANETDLQTLLMSRMYTVDYYDFETGTNSSFKYSLSNNDLPRTTDKPDVMENRKLTNNEFFKTSIRKLSKNMYFFPTNQLYEFSCKPANETFTDDNAVQANGTFCNFGPLVAVSKEKNQRPMNNQSYKSKLKSLEQTELDLTEGRRNFAVERTAWAAAQDFQDIFCENPNVRLEKVALHVPRLDNNDNDFDVNECSKSCMITAPRKHVCSNMEMEIEYNIRLTFWLYLVIRVFIGMIGGTAFAMFEGAVIAILREQKADYGLQRIYGSIGGMISSPLSGLLIDYASAGKGYTDFRPAFYLYAGLKIASGILMLTINLEFKSPANNVVSDVVTVLKKIEVIALFIACFILGTAWGYIESFLFWLIQDLGGSRSLMGITITVGGIAGIPLLVLSGPIIAKIGHANVLFIGCVFYAVRLLGYSLIYNPWYTLFFEALESVTSSLSFTAAVTYAAKLSTTTTDSSIQGLLGGLYYGVGKGSGSLIGGYLMKAFGTRPTYQIFAVLTLVTGLIYFFFNLLYLKKHTQEEGNDIVKKAPKPAKDQNGLENGVVEIPLDEKKPSKEERIIEEGVENEGFAKDRDENCPSKDIETVNNAKNELKCRPKDNQSVKNTRSDKGRPSKDLGNGNHFQREANRTSKDIRTSASDEKCPSKDTEETNNTRNIVDPSKDDRTVNANNLEEESERTRGGDDRRTSESFSKQDEPDRKDQSTAKENLAYTHENEIDCRQDVSVQNEPEVKK